MCSDYPRSALMYVDYGGDTYAGMGIKAMKSFGRPRGRNPKDAAEPVSLFALGLVARRNEA